MKTLKKAQRLPRALRKEPNLADEAMEVLTSAISGDFPRMADESQANYELRLKSVAFTIVARLGKVLVRVGDSKKVD